MHACLTRRHCTAGHLLRAQGALVLYGRVIRPLLYKHASKLDPIFNRTNQALNSRVTGFAAGLVEKYGPEVAEKAMQAVSSSRVLVCVCVYVCVRLCDVDDDDGGGDGDGADDDEDGVDGLYIFCVHNSQLLCQAYYSCQASVVWSGSSRYRLACLLAAVQSRPLYWRPIPPRKCFLTRDGWVLSLRHLRHAS